MLRFLITIIAGIFIIAIVGSVLLEQFPDLQPLWEEFKEIVVGLYESSKVKYGTIATVAIIICIVILFGTNNRRI